MYLSKGARQKGKKRTDTFYAPHVGAPCGGKGRIYSLPKASQHQRRWPDPKLTDADAQGLLNMRHTPPTHRHGYGEELGGGVISARGN